MIHLQLFTLSGLKYDEEVSEVVLPTMEGEIGVLTDHMPLVSVVAPGIIAVRQNSKDPDSKMQSYATNGGVIEVKDNILRVLVDEADNSDEINEQEAKEALARAKKLKLEAKDEVDLEKAQAMVDLSAVRLKVAELKRRKH